MNKDNTKAPCSILEDKQLKLFDFFEEFSENDGMHDMAEAIISRKKMPRLLSMENNGEDSEEEELFLPDANDWVLCDAKILQDSKRNYYYAVVEREQYGSKDGEKPLSYHQYLYEER